MLNKRFAAKDAWQQFPNWKRKSRRRCYILIKNTSSDICNDLKTIVLRLLLSQDKGVVPIAKIPFIVDYYLYTV